MNKPKKPRQPIQPSKPYNPKPMPPSKTIKANGVLCKFSFGSYDSMPLQKFMEEISMACPRSPYHSSRYRDDLTINIDHEEEWGYYDSHTTKTIMTISGETESANPKYEEEYKAYQKEMKKYEAAKPKHKEKMSQYKEDVKNYNKDMETYTMEEAEYKVYQWRERIKREENRLMKMKEGK